MPIDVTAVLWDPLMGGVPLSEHAWRIYSLPATGSHYWHDRVGYVVERAEQSGSRPRVHFKRDREWEAAMRAGLPDDMRIEGGRRWDDGLWHFEIVNVRDQRGAWSVGSDLERTIRESVARAIAAIGWSQRSS